MHESCTVEIVPEGFFFVFFVLFFSVGIIPRKSTDLAVTCLQKTNCVLSILQSAAKNQNVGAFLLCT